MINGFKVKCSGTIVSTLMVQPNIFIHSLLDLYCPLQKAKMDNRVFAFLCVFLPVSKIYCDSLNIFYKTCQK